MTGVSKQKGSYPPGNEHHALPFVFVLLATAYEILKAAARGSVSGHFAVCLRDVSTGGAAARPVSASCARSVPAQCPFSARSVPAQCPLEILGKNAPLRVKRN